MTALRQEALIGYDDSPPHLHIHTTDRHSTMTGRHDHTTGDNGGTYNTMGTQGGSGGAARKAVRFVSPPQSPLVQNTGAAILNFSGGESTTKGKGKGENNNGVGEKDEEVISRQEAGGKKERGNEDGKRENEEKGEYIVTRLAPLSTQPNFIYM